MKKCLGVLSDGMKNGAQDPTVVLDEYGADALRLYLINSPVVRGETLRFKKEGVFAVVKDVFLPWYNAYRFLVQNVLRLQQQTGIAFEPTKVTLLICLCTRPCKRQTQSLLAVSNLLAAQHIVVLLAHVTPSNLSTYHA